MEQTDKYIEFLHNSLLSQKISKSRNIDLTETSISKMAYIGQYYGDYSDDISRVNGEKRNDVYTYIKSCQYTEHLVEPLETKNKELRNEIQELKLANSSLVKSSYLQIKDLSSENQELKSLIYGILDEINELKEHNRSLSERIEYLENKPPIILN